MRLRFPGEKYLNVYKYPMGMEGPTVIDLDTERLVTPGTARRMRSRVVELDRGEEVGVHRTSGKEELIIVLEGTPTFVGGGKELKASPGQAVYVPIDLDHNVVNRTEGKVRYIYVLALHSDHVPGGHHDALS